MKIAFHGAAGEVTGSRFLLQTDSVRVLLDCGMFQGHRKQALEKNRAFHFKPSEVDAVILSHAHIDHSGMLPLLYKRGFRGRVHCTRPTVDLCRIMLTDSARIQVEDAKFFNKIHASTGETIEPLYSEEDAEGALKLFVGHEYGEAIELGDGTRSRLHNAGHVLGSAMIEVEARGPKGVRRVFDTGDLGRRQTLLMDPPDAPKNVDYLIIETTYGDKVHDPVAAIEPRLTELVQAAVKARGKILIPSFALERTQEILFVLNKLTREKAVPPVPVYVDSPMAVNITEVFSRHLASFSFSDAFKAYVAEEGDPFVLPNVRYVRTKDESQRLNDLPGPLIIISASGMCEGGRILHHLRNNVGDDNTTILIVGYQAQGTLGRRLVEGAKKVRIFGLEHEVAASVKVMHTFSAHADKNDLLRFIGGLAPRPRRIFLVHGDPSDRRSLTEDLKTAGVDGGRVHSPEFQEEVELE